MMKISLLALAALVVIASPADAAGRHKKKHHHASQRVEKVVKDSNDLAYDERTGTYGLVKQTDGGTKFSSRSHTAARAEGHYRGRDFWNRISIPTPAGTWRVARSCGQRLAAYWNLGKGLDAVVTWRSRFTRTTTPGPHVAIVARGHVFGIDGGHEGAWKIVSFNGDGHHGNVAFTVSSVRGMGTLVDTTQPVAAHSGHRRYASR